MKRSVSLPSPRYRVDKNGKLVQHNLMDPVEVGNLIGDKIMDQRKNLKWRFFSRIFTVAFLLFIAPAGGSNIAGHSLTIT